MNFGQQLCSKIHILSPQNGEKYTAQQPRHNTTTTSYIINVSPFICFLFAQACRYFAYLRRVDYISFYFLLHKLNNLWKLLLLIYITLLWKKTIRKFRSGWTLSFAKLENTKSNNDILKVKKRKFGENMVHILN